MSSACSRPFATLGEGTLTIVGGGAKGPLWRQIKADVTALPVRVPESVETTATGARLLEILSKVQDPSATLNALPDAVCTPELHIHTAEGENHALLAHLQKTANFTDPKEIITLDGLRVEYADGFGLCAPQQHHAGDRAAF